MKYVEYIQNGTGTALTSNYVIDLLYVPTDNTKVEIEFESDHKLAGEIFGTYLSYPQAEGKLFRLFGWDYDIAFDCPKDGSARIRTGFDLNTRQVFIAYISGGKIYLENNTKGTSVNQTMPQSLGGNLTLKLWSTAYNNCSPVLKVYSIKIYESDVLQMDLRPAINNSNVIGLYDVEGGGFYTNSAGGTLIAGPDLSSIGINPYSKSVKATGETFTIDVTTENSWVANPADGTWYTISPTGATGDATVTISVPSYSGVTARQDTITFVDTNTTDEATFTLKQKKYQSGQPFYLGGDEVGECYIGDGAVTEAYLGEDLVFSTGPFVGLKASPKSLTFSNSTLTGQFKVKSSEQWSLTTPEWITASTSTGDTGETIVSVTATTQTAATSSTISISSTSFSASVQTDYVFYTAVSYIYATDHSRYSTYTHIDTGIEHTASTMTIEFEYYGLGGNSDRMVGYQQGDAGCSSDSSDFRLFGYQNGCFDYMTYRSGFGSGYNSGYHHCTIGDCFCYDNESDTYKCQGTAVGSVPSPNCHILVDVSYIKVKSVKIKDGNNVLFDGVAATFEGNVGLFDLVSGQLIYNSNVPMSYDE